jgi:hydrogenase-4 component E
MYAWSDTFLVFLILSNLLLLGSSRLAIYIRVAAAQGFVLGLLPILTHLEDPGSRIALLTGLGLVTMGVKGVLFPWLLFRALEQAKVRREPKPFVGYSLSILVGIVALAMSLRVAARLPLPSSGFSPLAVPVGLFTFFVGLFLIISRRKALTQVLGYLVLENGIYTLGVALVAEVSILVELGVLLDAFVAVFVMQIAIYHISHEFNSTDVDRLTSLRG